MNPLPPNLAAKLARARTRHRLVTLGTAAAQSLALGIAWMMLAALLDWWAPLPRGLRVVLALGNIAATLACFTWRGVLPARQGLDDESIALAVEHLEPAFSTRLIAAVQFAQVAPAHGGTLVDAMVRETETLAAPVQFTRVISTRPLRHFAIAAAVALLVAALLFLAGGSRSGPFLGRAWGAATPWPARTRVEVLSGSFLVGIGDRTTLTAKAHGTQPAAGRAEVTYASGRRQTVTLARSTSNFYSGDLDSVPEPFHYRIYLYDGVSGDFEVAAEPRPAIKSIACTQISPAYTGVGELPRPASDLTVLNGSRLRITVFPSKPLREGGGGRATGDSSRLVISGRAASASGGGSIRLQPDAKQPGAWSAEFDPTPETAGFAVHLVDQRGLDSKEDPVFSLRLVADRAPRIRINSPRQREMLVTADAAIPLAFTADDDFGLVGISLRYRVGEGELESVPLEVAPGSRDLAATFTWPLAKLAPPAGYASLEGTILEFYLEARDARPDAVATASDHYQLRVVSRAEKQSELIARMAESFSAVRDLGDRQAKAAADLRSLIIAPPSTQPVH